MMTVQVASANELAAYFRQRRAVEDGDHWYGGSSYEGGIDQWIQWPEWLSSRCDDRYSALDAGGCCRDSGNTVVRLALNVSDMAQEVLARFAQDEHGGRGERGCASTAADLVPLVDVVPQFVAGIRRALAGADRALTVQLGCALDRMSLFIGRLAARRRCPWRCAQHGHPDRGADLAPLRAQIEECSGAIWDALHPRIGAPADRPGRRGQNVRTSRPRTPPASSRR